MCGYHWVLIHINEETLQSSLEACCIQVWLVNSIYQQCDQANIWSFLGRLPNISIYKHKHKHWMVNFSRKLFLQTLSPFLRQRMPGCQNSGSQLVEKAGDEQEEWCCVRGKNPSHFSMAIIFQWVWWLQVQSPPKSTLPECKCSLSARVKEERCGYLKM